MQKVLAAVLTALLLLTGRPAAPAEAFHSADVTIGDTCFYALPALTEAEMEALWGPARETARYNLVQDELAETRYYDGVTVRCTFYEDEAGTHYWLGALAYTRPDLAYVRGVCVGDAMEGVLKSFRDDGDRAVRETAFGDAAVLYGTPQYGDAFGLIRYTGDAPAEILYQEDGLGVIFRLDEAGAVSGIEVLGPLSEIQERLRVE